MKPDLYRNIEMVMQVICVSCIKLRVKSDAESMISRYDIHNNDSDVSLKKLFNRKCL